MQNDFETILSILKFCARTDTFFYMKLTGRILNLIMINMNEKCLSVMKI